MKKIFNLIKRIAILFLLLSVAWVVLYRFIPVPFTYLMFQRWIENKWENKEARILHDWVPAKEISNKLQLAVFCSEDQNFIWHWGFDFSAIEKATKYNDRQKKRKRTKFRGASTITQQCAKNVFLWPSRSYIRKGFEVYFTILIELFWSKQRIMEVYLNSIEMGNGIYGAEAASQYYFHHSARNLSSSEAAAIAAVLPNPRKWNPTKPTPFIVRRKMWILNQMASWGGNLDYDMPKPDLDK